MLLSQSCLLVDHEKLGMFLLRKLVTYCEYGLGLTSANLSRKARILLDSFFSL